MSVQMLAGNHVLRFLGLDPNRLMSQLENFQSPQSSVLQQMRDGFQFAAGFTAATQLASMLQSGAVPPAMQMAAPDMSYCNCGDMYAEPQTMDFGSMPGVSPFSLQGLMARQQGAMFERLLQNNPFIRQQIEMMLGGRIMPDGLSDGRVQVMPFPPGMMSPGGTPNPAAMAAMGFMNQIMTGAQMMGPLGPTGMFNQMMMGALAHLMGSMTGAGNTANSGTAGNSGGANSANRSSGNPLVDWLQEIVRQGRPGQPGQGNLANVVGGAGAGGANGAGGGAFPNLGMHPGGNNSTPTQNAFGLGGHTDTTAVLNDSSLTVEDKVMLMLMLIMKQMDKDIEKQAKYVESLQRNQNNGQGGQSSPSIDIESMKLKRLVDKRGQMFDILRQIIDKYNETAKNIIQSIGR